MARPRRQLEKVTLRLYLGDKERVTSYFPEMGHTKAIRELIHRTLRKLDEELSEQLTDIPEEIL